MASSRIVEAVDVFEYRHLRLASCFPRMSPDQFCLDGFEEGFDGGVIIAITFSAHRYLEAMLALNLLIVVRTILRPAIRVVNAAFGWPSERNGHLQRSDCKIPFHTIVDRPADPPPRMQIQDHSKIQPTFARPDIADVSCPLLIWLIR